MLIPLLIGVNSICFQVCLRVFIKLACFFLLLPCVTVVQSGLIHFTVHESAYISYHADATVEKTTAKGSIVRILTVDWDAAILWIHRQTCLLHMF